MLLNGAGSEGGWDWHDRADAPLTLRVVRGDGVFIATFSSVAGERQLQEADCATLLFAAAAIAPLLWEEVEPFLALGGPAKATFRAQPQTRDSRWFASAAVHMGSGELPGITRGGALKLGLQRRPWEFAATIEYSDANADIESPVATVSFTKVVARPTTCGFAGNRFKARLCLGPAVGVLHAKPRGEVIATSDSSLYLGLGGSAGLSVELATRYQLGIAVAAEVPLLRRRYAFDPTPTVTDVRGPAANAVVSFSYIFSDRS